MELKGGLTVLNIGAPGTGKSHMAGTIVEVPGVNRALLLAPKPREINSFKYREYREKIDAEVFRDHGWAPTVGSFDSGAFTRLFQRVLDLYIDDTYDAVICDPFTDVANLASHEILMPERAGSPKDLRDSISFYSALSYKLKDFTQALTGLASADLKRPKHVIVTVHAQPTKEEDMKGKATPEGEAKGVSFMGDALPKIEGGYRRDIAGEFDIVCFSSLKYETVRVGNKMERKSSYVVQLNADPERHAKAAIVPRLEVGEVPNSMVDIFRVIEEAGA